MFTLVAVGKIKLVRDKHKKIAVRQRSGLYLAHEKDVQAYNARVEEDDDDDFLTKAKKTGRDASTAKEVGFDVSSELKGVEETKKLKELERILSEGNLEKISQLVQEDREDQYAFGKLKLNISEPDFYNFIRDKNEWLNLQTVNVARCAHKAISSRSPPPCTTTSYVATTPWRSARERRRHGKHIARWVT